MKKMNTRTRILLVILPIAILPIILISTFSTASIYKRMVQQSKRFYSDIITQTATNIDFYYDQYAINFIDVTASHIFQKTLERPAGGEIPLINGVKYTRAMRDLLLSKIKGDFFLIELNRRDEINNTWYTVSNFTQNDITIHVDSLMIDPVFKKMENNGDMTPVMGISKALDGFKIENRPALFCPYLTEGEEEIKNIMVIVESHDLLSSLYLKNTSLKLGTLYIMDQFHNIMDVNHPSPNDYYTYDSKKKKYVLTPGDELNDPYEGMSFSEYRLLNTDPEIFSNKSVVKQIALIDSAELEEPDCQTITYNGTKYLSIALKAKHSGVKFVYFHPMKQIYAPILRVVHIIVCIAVCVLILIFISSFLFSKYFTRPITELTLAHRIVKSGDYTYQLHPNDFFGEFVELSDSFNRMVSTIHDYSENMEELVKKRTEELNQAVKELTEVNEKNKKELQMAQKIQSSLIPKVFPSTDLLTFSAMYMPMEAIGGDLYDVYQITNTIFGIMILDVCGHGVPAALITTMAKISFSNNAKKEVDPSTVLSSVNEELCDAINGSGDFLTAFYCVIDIANNTLTFSNAGHNQMLLLHSDGELEDLPNNGPVIGVFKNMTFHSQTIQLTNKDRLILYTDGVIEARSAKLELYDEDRLFKIIKENRQKPVRVFVENLYNDLLHFKEDTPHNDDIALLAIDIIGMR